MVLKIDIGGYINCYIFDYWCNYFVFFCVSWCVVRSMISSIGIFIQFSLMASTTVFRLRLSLSLLSLYCIYPLLCPLLWLLSLSILSPYRQQFKQQQAGATMHNKNKTKENLKNNNKQLSHFSLEQKITGNQETYFSRILFNLSPPSAAYMCQCTGSALVQIMACRLFGGKPLSKPMLGSC